MPLAPLDNVLGVPPETHIWRYLTPSKFKNLLEKRALFFPKIARLRKDDPLEGSVPAREANHRRREALATFEYPLIGTDDFRKMIDTEDGIVDFHKNAYPELTVASCWHMRETESKAMWDRYANVKKSVAIRTTVSEIYKAFQACDLDIRIAPVRYLDFQSAIWCDKKHYDHPGYNFMIPNTTKSQEYEDERELRLLHRHDNWDYREFWSKQEHPTGIFIPVDLNHLICEVVFAPRTSRRAQNTIEHSLRQAGINPHCRRSSLDREPIY